MPLHREQDGVFSQLAARGGLGNRYGMAADLKLEAAGMRLAEPFLVTTRWANDLGVRDVQRMLIG